MEEKQKYPFDLEISLNDEVVLAQNFNISYFNWESMLSKDFLEVARGCVQMIKDDMASKSRVASWFYNSPDYKDGELLKNLPSYAIEHPEERVVWPVTDENGATQMVTTSYITKEHTFPQEISEYEEKAEPWAYTFKFTVKRDGKEMFSEIWDGSVYHSIVRNHLDLTNDQTKYEMDDDDTVPFKLVMYRAMAAGKKNIIAAIIRRITNVCHPEKLIRDENGRVIERQGEYATTMDYELGDTYKGGENGKSIRYEYGMVTRQKQLSQELAKTKGVAKKNRDYKQLVYGRV